MGAKRVMLSEPAFGRAMKSLERFEVQPPCTYQQYKDKFEADRKATLKPKKLTAKARKERAKAEAAEEQEAKEEKEEQERAAHVKKDEALSQVLKVGLGEAAASFGDDYAEAKARDLAEEQEAKEEKKEEKKVEAVAKKKRLTAKQIELNRLEAQRLKKQRQRAARSEEKIKADKETANDLQNARNRAKRGKILIDQMLIEADLLRAAREEKEEKEEQERAARQRAMDRMFD
jgi:hypothetical protein